MRKSFRLALLIDDILQLTLFLLDSLPVKASLVKDEGYCKNFSIQISFTFPHKIFNTRTSSLFPSGSSTKTIRSPCPALMVSTVKMAGCFTMFP